MQLQFLLPLLHPNHQNHLDLSYHDLEWSFHFLYDTIHLRNGNSTPSGGNKNPNGFGDWDADEEARIAVAFKDGDQAISVNGGNQVTATVTTNYPTDNITKMWIGSAGGNGSGQFEGTISRIAYYPKQLTDNQLNTLTAS